MTPDMQLALPARAENIAIVRHALGAFGEMLALDTQTLSDIRLAVTEACTNVVVHAYPDDKEGPLEVLASLAEEQLTVVVRDEGKGITPRPDSPGMGLGLPLIASLAESVALTRDDCERTEVQMTFALGAGSIHQLSSQLAGSHTSESRPSTQESPPSVPPTPSTNGGDSSEDASIPPIGS